jgi:hypothetical protein
MSMAENPYIVLGIIQLSCLDAEVQLLQISGGLIISCF